MLAEYTKIFVAHDVTIVKWDIPYHLPCVSVLMWQIKRDIPIHLPYTKKTVFLDVAIFFWDIPAYPIFFIHPFNHCCGVKMGYEISHISFNSCCTGA